MNSTNRQLPIVTMNTATPTGTLLVLSIADAVPLLTKTILARAARTATRFLHLMSLKGRTPLLFCFSLFFRYRSACSRSGRSRRLKQSRQLHSDEHSFPDRRQSQYLHISNDPHCNSFRQCAFWQLQCTVSVSLWAAATPFAEAALNAVFSCLRFTPARAGDAGLASVAGTIGLP